MENKPNCYKCKHRQPCPGSAHSQCKHPNSRLVSDPLLNILNIFASVGRTACPCLHELSGLNIRANQHGIAQGWFCWPENFDPAWLESCDGFEER